MNRTILLRLSQGTARLFAIFCLLCAVASVAQVSPSLNSAPDTNGTFWLIPHTHWEGAVFKTREEYLEMGLPNILTAVRLLKEHPNYRFTLDQVAYFKPFLERYPEEAASFRKFVAEGRLQIVCGLNVMPDDNMPSGESFIRQLLYAKGYSRKELGVDVKVGWLLDTFGHHAQMPQLLKLAGFNSFWFFRGVEQRKNMPSEFLWEGLDGTRIPAFWLPFAYGHLYGPPGDLPGFSDFVQNRYDALSPFSRGRDRVGLAGVDVSEPELHVAALVDQFNQRTNKPFTLRIGVPTDFEDAVARRSDRPIITGERNPLFQGIYSSRIELKQTMRETERLLTTAEKFAALANWSGARTEHRLQSAEMHIEDSVDAMILRAWEPALFNVTHDLASGVMTDAVYQDTVRGYDFSQRLGREILETDLAALTSQIDTRGDGVATIIFNTLGWLRTDLAQADVGFAETGVHDFNVVDPGGKSVPAQLISAEHFADGGLKRIKIAFTAQNVPALGHAVYHVVPRRAKAETPTGSEKISGNVLETDFYRVAIDLATGALTNVFVKRRDWEALSGPANVVARETDKGDFWELYKNLDGFQNVIVTRPLDVPKRGRAEFSDEATTNRISASILRGSVFSEYNLKRPFGTATFATTVRLYSGVPRIDFETKILNNSKAVRYRLLVPTSIENGHGVHEIPFGAIERPLAQEFPAQNWIDCSDGRRGVALLNRGLPGNNVADGTLMLSLLRSTSIRNYGIGGGFEGQSSDSGLELGKEMTFHYALSPHEGDWRDAQVFRSGLEFNNPLIVHKAAAHPGKLPARWGLLEISPANIVLSALKPGRDGAVIARVYEASGKPSTNATVRLHAKIRSAREVNLMEDPGAKLSVRDNSVHLDFHPFEIKTCEFTLSAP